MSGYEEDGGASGETAGTWRLITLAAIAVLGAAVLVALILTQHAANRERDRAIALQSHSYDVMILARTVQGTIGAAEAALGRYVISADTAMGRTYAADWSDAGDQVDRLAWLVRDDAAQRATVARLQTAFEQRGAELDRIALNTRYKKNDQALGLYYAARNTAALTAIDTALTRTIDRERTLLDARTDATAETIAWSTTASRVLAVFGIALVIGAVILGGVIVLALGERARAEAEAAAERDRSAELSEAVDQATADLAERDRRLRQVEKMQAIGQLTGGIAHDFNNMLAVVLGGLELARRHMDERHASRRHIESAIEGAERAAGLTRRLLAFSREEQLEAEPFAPGEQIAGMRDLIDRTLGDAIVVSVEDESDGWRVHADRLQFENALINLAVNARDAMEGRGTLGIAARRVVLSDGEIGACAAGEHLAVSVSDTGCGMDAATMARVFEPFFTTKPVGRGTGLGLSQVFAFARAADGDVGLRSAPGEGTTVIIYLPRDVAALVAESVVVAPAMVADARYDILVVEDDPRVLAATTEALLEIGHRPVGCPDPLDAPAMLEANPLIEIVVSDVLMPGQAGPEMVAGLVQRFPHLGVLFVTGFAGDASEESFGDHPVLRKPFTIAALERAVAEAAAQRQLPPECLAAE